jgi:glutaredoxin 3
MYIIYGKKLCSYCNKAVTLLQSRGLSFVYHSMDDRADELVEISTIYNWRTVPLVIKTKDSDSKFIGGYDDLVKRLQIEISEEDD